MIIEPPYSNIVDEKITPVYYTACPTRLSGCSNKDMTFSYRQHSAPMTSNELLKGVRTLTSHTMLFMLEGEVHLNWDEHRDVVIKAGEMCFLPRGAEISIYRTGKASYISAKIDRGMTSKELEDLRNMRRFEEFENFRLKPLTMYPPMQRYVESIRDYLLSGVNCPHMHEAKSHELYVILHWYYSIAENAQLFYPMAGTMSAFKDFILENYNITTTIEELVAKSNMSRSTFDRKFKETFDTTPLKWIDELTRQRIISRAAEPGITVKDIMYEVGVYNPSQFTQLCKRLCGVTPTELIRQA